MADREQQLVLSRSEYQHVLSSHEHTRQQFDGEGEGEGKGGVRRGGMGRFGCVRGV